MNNKLKLGVMGLVSGSASTFSGSIVDALISYFKITDLPGSSLKWNYIEYLPGIIFGIAVGLFFLKLRPMSKPAVRIPLWIAASLVSYFLAVQTTLQIYASHIQQLPKIDPPLQWQVFAFFVGGLVGASVLLLAFSFLLTHLTLAKYLIITLLGGVLGVSGVIHGLPALFELAPLFIIWQTGMAFALGWVLDQKENPPLPQT